MWSDKPRESREAVIEFIKSRYWTDLGYLVVSIDNRGTPAPKGAAWRRKVFGSLGPLSTEEQEAGLKELGRMYPYVDLSRVGIWERDVGACQSADYPVSP